MVERTHTSVFRANAHAPLYHRSKGLVRAVEPDRFIAPRANATRKWTDLLRQTKSTGATEAIRPIKRRPIETHDGGIVAGNHFAIGRGLHEIECTFGSLLERAGDGVWYDLGSGEANLHLDALALGTKARLISMGVTKPDSPGLEKMLQTTPKDKFDYWHGKYFEDYDLTELPLGRLITAYFAAPNYAHHFDRVLDRSLQLLHVGGKALFYMGGELSTAIVDGNGRSVALQDWLKRIPGIAVHRLAAGELTFEITKLSETARAPELEERGYFPSTPPYRLYRSERPEPSAFRLDGAFPDSLDRTVRMDGPAAFDRAVDGYGFFVQKGTLNGHSRVHRGLFGHLAPQIRPEWRPDTEQTTAPIFAGLDEHALTRPDLPDGSIDCLTAFGGVFSWVWKSQPIMKRVLPEALSGARKKLKPTGQLIIGPLTRETAAAIKAASRAAGLQVADGITVNISGVEISTLRLTPSAAVAATETKE